MKDVFAGFDEEPKAVHLTGEGIDPLAYMCPVCMAVYGHRGWADEEEAGRIVEQSRQAAEACCRCIDCSRVVEEPTRHPLKPDQCIDCHIQDERRALEKTRQMALEREKRIEDLVAKRIGLESGS